MQEECGSSSPSCLESRQGPAVHTARVDACLHTHFERQHWYLNIGKTHPKALMKFVLQTANLSWVAPHELKHRQQQSEAGGS